MAASFPGAVKTFATRSNGQTIDASHVNDLQDEVNAIEAGYLNGTANLNSSKSTVASLSVTGASTFAGNVNMTGNLNAAGNSTLNVVIIAGTLQVSGNSSYAGGLTVSGASTFGGDAIFVSTVAISGGLNLSSVVNLIEVSTVAAAAANGGRLYLRDNGAGKTELRIIFQSGAGVLIATEP